MPSQIGAFWGVLPFHVLLQAAFWGVLSGSLWTYVLF